MRSLESGNPEQLEEERRLCYVGMTRAKKHLYLVRAFRRAFSGHHPPSRFLMDIPPDLVAQSQRASSADAHARPPPLRNARPEAGRGDARSRAPKRPSPPATTSATRSSARASSSRASPPAATTRSSSPSRARPASRSSCCPSRRWSMSPRNRSLPWCTMIRTIQGRIPHDYFIDCDSRHLRRRLQGRRARPSRRTSSRTARSAPRSRSSSRGRPSSTSGAATLTPRAPASGSATRSSTSTRPRRASPPPARTAWSSRASST